MGDVFLTLAPLRDASTFLALVLAGQTLTTTLVLLGATTLAAVALALVARSARAVVVDVTSVPAGRRRRALAVRPPVTQSDPDAPGRPRPRAPGLLLG